MIISVLQSRGRSQYRATLRKYDTWKELDAWKCDKPFRVQFWQKGHATYTTMPSSTKSVFEGKIGLPSVPRAGSMLAAHSIDAMVMINALFATFIPMQIRRPKPWRTLIFWLNNIYMHAYHMLRDLVHVYSEGWHDFSPHLGIARAGIHRNRDRHWDP